SHGAFAAGGYADIDTLCQQQAVERNRMRREALLQRIQQLTIDRVMFAPIMDFRALVGLGPRIAEHAIDAIPLHAFPAWEDVRLQGQRVQVASQPRGVAQPAPSPAPARDTGETVSPAEPPAEPLDHSTPFVVMDGIVTPQMLQQRVSHYKNIPRIRGFSAQSAPQKSIQELAARGRFVSRSLSVTTVAQLQEAAHSVGMQIKVISAPGRTVFHSIVVVPNFLSAAAAEALSKAFRQMPNPVL